jgi:hypothetical protein
MHAPRWLVVVALAVPAVARAGTGEGAEPAVSPVLADTPAAAMFAPVEPAGCPWRADVLVGLPMGVRIQRHFLGPLWLEAGASLYLVIPAAYGAARFDIRVSDVDGESFHVRPGAGLGVTPRNSIGDWDDDRTVLWATGDVDFVWRHQWRKGLYGEFGFKLGVLFPTNGADPIPIPRAALLFGVQF